MRSTARFILSRRQAIAQYQQLQELTGHIAYSYKTNPHVGRVLRDNTDADFAVHSLRTAREIGCPERLFFFAQGWDTEEIHELLTEGIRAFVVDNRADLAVLERALQDTEQSITLLLRMKLKERTLHTGKHFVFGMYAGEIEHHVHRLKQHGSIARLGVHVHRKTQNVSEWSLRQELGQALPEETLQAIDCLNIGGGIPSRYKNYSADMLQDIFSRIRDLRDWLREYNIDMIIEPGRYIAAPAVRLEARIVNLYDNNILINCSVFNGAMDTFIANIRLLLKEELSEGTPYTIKGNTPDSVDIFRYRVFLDRPQVGDTLTFLNAGAYTFATDFAGLEPLPVEEVEEFSE